MFDHLEIAGHRSDGAAGPRSIYDLNWLRVRDPYASRRF
jgi:hypothetical protein